MCFSSWKLVAAIGITFYAYKLTEHVIGAPINLPDYINSHPAVTTLTVQPNTKSPYNDRLCFFRCLACHFKFRKDHLERPALQLARTYAEDKGINIKNFKGVGLNDLSYFEQRHNLRIHVYSLHIHPQDHSRLPFARLERRPLHVGDSSTTDLYLNLFDYTHFSYIHNLSLYAQTFGCTCCPKLLKSSKDLLNHFRTCTGSTKHTYKGGVCLPETNCPQKLEE